MEAAVASQRGGIVSYCATALFRMFYIIPNDFLGDWFLLLPLLDSSLRYYVSDEALLNCLVLLVQLSFCLAEIS